MLECLSFKQSKTKTTLVGEHLMDTQNNTQVGYTFLQPTLRPPEFRIHQSFI